MASNTLNLPTEETLQSIATSLQTMQGNVSGVKGNEEVTYRTGQVNLTAANIGALPSNTTYVSSVNGGSGAVTGIATQQELNEVRSIAEGAYATNSTTELKYSSINNISISADTTYTLATAPNNTYPEYKANITNTDTSNAITITLPSGTVIKGNVTISSNTFEIPADSSVEVNIQNGKAIVVNWGA